MGNLVPQNHKGDLIGQIRDLGRRSPFERAYATNEDLGFHTDSTDASGQSGEVEIHQGDTMWRDAEEHSATNTGRTEMRALFIEMK